MADRFIEVTKKTPYGVKAMAVRPKTFEKRLRDEGWKAGRYEDGDHEKYELVKRESKASKTSASKTGTGTNAEPDSGVTNASPSRTTQGTDQTPQSHP